MATWTNKYSSDIGCHIINKTHLSVCNTVNVSPLAPNQSHLFTQLTHHRSCYYPRRWLHVNNNLQDGVVDAWPGRLAMTVDFTCTRNLYGAIVACYTLVLHRQHTGVSAISRSYILGRTLLWHMNWSENTHCMIYGTYNILLSCRLYAELGLSAWC